MKRFSIWQAVPVAVLVMAAAGCTDPTEGKTAAKVSAPVDVAKPAAPAPTDGGTPTPVAAIPTAEAGKAYAFSGTGSSIGFEGSKVTGTHTGGFSKFDGKATAPGGDATKGQIDITIDMNSTFSDDPSLTTKLKSADFFDTEKFATATFTSTSIAASGDKFDVTGNLTLHGVTKGITFPADIKIDGDSLKATAEFSINRMDWGIVYPGLADDAIRENVLLYFDVKAKV